MKQPTKPFALCIDNTDYKVSLIPGKIYRIIPDPRAARDDFVRIVDESGEDYLYHKSHFLFVAPNQRDLAIINRRAARLNREAKDVLDYQIIVCANGGFRK